MVEAVRIDCSAFTGHIQPFAPGVEWACYPVPPSIELTWYELMLIGEFPDVREYRWVIITNPRAAWEFVQQTSVEMVEDWLEEAPPTKGGEETLAGGWPAARQEA